MEAAVIKECLLGFAAVVGPFVSYKVAVSNATKDLDKFSLDKLWEKCNKQEEAYVAFKAVAQLSERTLLDRAHDAELKVRNLENELGVCRRHVNHLRQEIKELKEKR